MAKKSRLNFKSLKIRAEKELSKAKEAKDLELFSKKYLSDRGELTLILRSLKCMPKARRASVGKQANSLKKSLEEKIAKKKLTFTESTQEKLDWLDVTAPGRKTMLGHLHPLTLVQRRVEEIFQSMGFSVISGPEMENEWYNFDALNIPNDHPARDLWDTFYLKNGLLLRTHTSPVQIRYMEKNQPPLRIIAPGRVFRREATDASHEANFYQVEGLMVGSDVSAANFKAVIQEFLRLFFDKPVKIRLIPSFFPFVEPGFQVDMTCLNCQGKGCPSCSQTGWLEMLGAGMVHPNVLKNAGLNPKYCQGFAFGVGMDRLAMMKYRISDIRLFYSGDLRFLQQF